MSVILILEYLVPKANGLAPSSLVSQNLAKMKQMNVSKDEAYLEVIRNTAGVAFAGTLYSVFLAETSDLLFCLAGADTVGFHTCVSFQVSYRYVDCVSHTFHGTRFSSLPGDTSKGPSRTGRCGRTHPASKFRRPFSAALYRCHPVGSAKMESCCSNGYTFSDTNVTSTHGFWFRCRPS